MTSTPPTTDRERELTEELATLTQMYEVCSRQRTELAAQNAVLRKQVALGFKHLIETPVLTDSEIESGYTAFLHMQACQMCRTSEEGWRDLDDERVAYINKIGDILGQKGEVSLEDTATEVMERIKELEEDRDTWKARAEFSFTERDKLIRTVADHVTVRVEQYAQIKELEAELTECTTSNKGVESALKDVPYRGTYADGVEYLKSELANLRLYAPAQRTASPTRAKALQDADLEYWGITE